jgi:hypothetical protein
MGQKFKTTVAESWEGIGVEIKQGSWWVSAVRDYAAKP